MKRLSVMALMVLTSSMLLFGCGKTEEQLPTEPTVEETTPEGTETPEVTETPEETVDPFADDEVAPEGMVRSQLTNEFVSEEVAKKRPIAIMINNIINAVPHSGVSQSSIIAIIRVRFPSTTHS